MSEFKGKTMVKESVDAPVQWPPVQPADDIRELTTTLEREYPDAAAGFTDSMSRRRWMQLMGASLAFGGMAMTGCRYQVEKIAPYAFRPSRRLPGVPVDYATCLDFAGVAHPVLAKSYDGRPIKLDGNPDHADMNGASDIFTQARILELYDPDRSQHPTLDGDESTWDAFFKEADRLMKQAGDGTSLAILSEISASPTVARLKTELLKKYPKATWAEYNSVANDNELAGTKLAFGKALRPHYALDKAKVIVAIDGDLLTQHPAAVKLGGLFAKGRDPDAPTMSRLYAVESQFSVTGGSADHRIALTPSKIAAFVAALEKKVDDELAHAADHGDDHVHPIDEDLPQKERVLQAMASDLVAAKGAGVIACGWAQPAEVHAAVWRINDKLENLGKTITWTEVEDRAPTVAMGDEKGALGSLVERIEGGAISTLLILNGNPVYDAPADVDFQSALGQVANSIHLSYYANETSRECKWHLNAAHPLEAWGDGRSYDGTYCIAQPLIRPLFGGHSTVELLARLLGAESHDGRDHVRATFDLVSPKAKVAGQDKAWNEAVHLGFLKDSQAKPVDVSLQTSDSKLTADGWSDEWRDGDLEVLFVPSRQLYDGRFANNGWLQELPDFVTKLTWDNAAIVSPRTADAKGLKQGTLVQVKVDGEEATLPVHIQPGHANGTITLALGYGREAAGRVGGDRDKGIEHIVGRDIGNLRTSGNWYFASGVEAIRSTTRFKLALTQDPFVMDSQGRSGIRARLGRNSALIRRGELESYKKFHESHDEHDDHDEEEHKKDAQTSKRHQLPVLNQVSFSDSKEGGDDDHHHGTHWPEGHDLHFANKSLTPGPELSETNKWGMGIDLTKCFGCNACVIACQSENNVAVVGKDQVSRGREMHWMRIDAYFVEPEDDSFAEEAEFTFQPVACHHCENAPCETVCPVAATVHSTEGLNDMVYNRCIGTRYCGNNCPYKVRRFNYLNYSEAVTMIKYPNEGQYDENEKQLLGLRVNPEVSVRSRGVMEKCSYCVQRIQNTKILARNEKRAIGPNEITTACQDACPAKAITFGDLSNQESDVAHAHENVRSYVMLEQLNNLPRTRYLARVLNPHPALVSHADDDQAAGH